MADIDWNKRRKWIRGRAEKATATVGGKLDGWVLFYAKLWQKTHERGFV